MHAFGDVEQLSVGGWNACRISGERAADVVEEFVREVGPGSVGLFQEVRGWPQGTVHGGELIRETGGDSAIWIPRDLLGIVKGRWRTSAVTAVALGAIGTVSAYLPDSSKALEEFA